MSEETKSKARPVTQIVSYTKPAVKGEKGSYVNIFTTLSMDGREFTVWDRGLTEETLLAEFRKGKERATAIYTNAVKSANGATDAAATSEPAPF